MWSAIISGVTNLASNYMEERKTKAESKARIQEAKTEAEVVSLKAEADLKVAKATAAMKMAEQGQAQNYDLDRLAMENMNKSWKDEAILIVFLCPMIMAFIPSLADYALRGFEIVSQMPEWYRYIIIGMVVVIYGLRGLLQKIIEQRKIG